MSFNEKIKKTEKINFWTIKNGEVGLRVLAENPQVEGWEYPSVCFCLETEVSQSDVHLSDAGVTVGVVRHGCTL